ncbi:MAG: NDP-sugar synthase, partial [Chloroflexi bacterium]|nr:NDP-sugar synthase [Chloroflexota bacterium]
MKAIILIGGQGTRLRPLTPRTSKQLVPLLNRPLLELLLRQLHGHGVREVTLAMTERSPAIEAAFGDGAQLGLRLERAYEGEPLGSGGAIAACAAGWDEPFLVCNGDIISDLDLGGLIEAHRARAAELSIALHEVEDPSQFGVVALDGDRIVEFVEKPAAGAAPSNWINAGVWLFEQSAARELDASSFSRVEDGLFPRMAAAGRAIVGFRHHGYWADVGNPVAYLRTNLDLLRGAVPDMLPELLPDGWPASGQALAAAAVSAAAAVRGPALLGAATTVAEGARIEDGVVAGARCSIGADALVASSVLWDDVTV